MQTSLHLTNKNPSANSFQELVNLWQRQPYCTQTDQSSLQVLLDTNSALKLVLNAGPCLCWILNVRTGQYVFVSENVGRFLGSQPGAFMQGGISFTSTLLHPADGPRLWKLVRQLWESLLALPAPQREDCQLNYDYRIRKADGSYIRVLEQSLVLDMDSRGNVTHLLGMCTDITNWKKGDTLTASLTSNETQQNLLYISSDDDWELNRVISKQEKKVLQLVIHGYTSKQIADRLSISLHTVNTHRRNIIRKTKSKNTGALISLLVNN